MKKLAMLFILAVVVTAAVYGYYLYSQENPEALSSDEPQGGDAVTLSDLDVRLLELGGATKSLTDYTDSILFINFWATWCGYCEKEMPDLIRLDRKLREEGIGRVVAIDVNEKEAIVKEYIEKMGFTELTILLDLKGEAAKLFDIQGYPTTFAFRDGSLVDYKVGMMTWQDMERMLEKAR